MSSIADFTSSLPEENRLYILRGQLAQMYKAGQGGRMGRLVIDPFWIAAQREFDPSLQTYLQGVELAIRAIEEGQAGERGLLLLMVLSLLHGDARAVTSSLPDEALQLMSREGRVEQARGLALQRPYPDERSQALLTVLQVEIGLGNRNSAAETLALARKEISDITDTGKRCRAMLSLLGIEQALTTDFDHFAKQLGQLCDLAQTISAWQARTHVMAEIADASVTAALNSGRPVHQDYGLTAIFNRCAKDIKKTYAAVKAYAEKQREENKSKIDRNAPFSYELWDDSPKADPVVQIIDELELWDRHVYLVDAALADRQTRWGEATPWLNSLSKPHIVASLLRTAGHLDDRATGKRITDLLLAGSNFKTRFQHQCSMGWDSEKVIEAAAAAGYGEVALKLIAHKLIDTADVGELRAALARGAGRRGDIENIERAASPIKPAGRPATLRDRFDRTMEGAGDRLEKSALSWLSAKGVSSADFERISVYVDGYTGLMEWDPKQAEAFLESVCRRLGPAGEKLLHELILVGTEGIEKQAAARVEKIISVTEHLPWADREELASDRVDYWLIRGDFDRALKAAEQGKNPTSRPPLLRLIASAMLKAGQMERAMSLAATIPERTQQRYLYQEALEYIAAGTSGETTGLTDRLTVGLGRLRNEDRLAKSAAFPALVAALTVRGAAAEVLDLLEPLGVEVLQAAFEPLAYGIARIEAAPQAAKAAERLLSVLEKQSISVPRIRSACALVRAWGPASYLAAAARRAYELALKDARSYKFSAPAPFAPSLSSAAKAPKETSILTELASAARSLNDQKVLSDLWEQANKIFTEKRGSEDLALIDICAGLAALGETWRKEYLYDFPFFKAIDSNHRSFACLEIARAEACLKPDVVYNARKRNILSAATDWGLEKLDTMIERDPSKKKDLSWGGYKAQWAEERLSTQQQVFVESVIQELPEMPQPAAARANKKGKQGTPAGKFIQQTNTSSETGPRFLSNKYKKSYVSAAYWLRMIQSLADLNAHHAIPRAVLAAQRCLETGKEQNTNLFGATNPEYVTPEEMETIIDTAMTSLLAAGKVDLARQLAQVVPDRHASIDARLAVTSNNPVEAKQILEICLEQTWSWINIKAIASSAASLPGQPERLALAIKILRKARERGRAGILEALGTLVPLASTLLAPEDLRSAVRRIIASEGDW